MAEFDDKLNNLLSNPQAMDQIMKMAQSLMGESGGQSAPPPPNPAPVPPQPVNPPPPPPGGGWTPSQAPAGGIPGLGSALGGIDPASLAALAPILQESGAAQNSNARQLLFALRPYLKPERQDKVERALQLARLFRVGKKFLLKGDRHV